MSGRDARRSSAVLLAVLLVLVAVSGCQWPRDPEGTLDRVRDGVLRVGVTESEPWVTLGGGEPDGVEVRLVRRLAAELRADVRWTRGSEAELMSALEVRALDLVIGGLEQTSPWTKEASLIRPYFQTRRLVGVPGGSPPPADIAGVEVVVEEGTAEVGLLAKTDAVPVVVPDASGVSDRPVVVDDFELGPRGLRSAGVELSEHKHVVAVPLGENGWQTTVERFFMARTRAEIRRLLAEETAS